MHGDDISELTASELLSAIRDNDADRDYAYRATQEVLKRWRRGLELGPLIDLICSDNAIERGLGAYYISELGQEVHDLNLIVKKLANDVMADCRRAFVSYFENSNYYDKSIGAAMAECLVDFHLAVRVSVIRWAAGATEEKFEEFARLVEAGTGWPTSRLSNSFINDYWTDASRKRAFRGLEIIRRMRKGDEIQKIREEISEEDSFIFDTLRYRRITGELWSKWKTTRSRP